MVRAALGGMHVLMSEQFSFEQCRELSSLCA